MRTSVDAGLDQPRAGDEARDAAADKGEGDVVEQRLAINRLGIRIVL